MLIGLTVTAHAGGLEKDEVVIPLDKLQDIRNGNEKVSISIHDHGSDTISVRINWGNTERLQKPLGTDTNGDNKLLIYHGNEWDLFYVNSPSAPMNSCLLKLIRFR